MVGPGRGAPGASWRWILPRAMAWRIGLSPWVIQDGNYGDFRVGRRIDMAVECGNGDPVTATTAQPSLTHTGEDEDFQPTYATCADVVYRPSTAGWRGVHSPTWWPWRKLTQEVVLDCAPFRVLAESYAASMIADDVTRFAAPQATLEAEKVNPFRSFQGLRPSVAPQEAGLSVHLRCVRSMTAKLVTAYVYCLGASKRFIGGKVDGVSAP